jgi:hypothetical protein
MIMRIIFLFITTFIFAQSEPEQPVNFPIPSSVYEFQRFGDFSANEYKGLANISIPIHEVKVDDVSIPIQANYFTGGIKVNEEAGIIGLGWNMNFPSIVQEVRSYPDFVNPFRYKKLPPFQGNPSQILDGPYSIQFTGYNLDLSQYVGVPGVQSIPYFGLVYGGLMLGHNGYYNTLGKYYQMLNWYNTEPDIFSVSLNGVDIKFCLEQSQDDETHTQGEFINPFKIINGRTEYKIEAIPKGTSPYYDLAIDGIRITDPGGNTYTFSTIEKHEASGCVVASTIVYKITNILTKGGKVIDFQYDNITSVIESPKIESHFYKRVGPSLEEWAGIANGMAGLLDTAYYTGTFGSNSLNICFYNSENNGFFEIDTYVGSNLQLLKQISTFSENVFFNHSERVDFQNAKKLDNIIVENKLHENVKQINFNYDYFVSTESSNSYVGSSNVIVNMQEKLKHRLKLNSIEFVGDNPYEFIYNSTLLPKKNSYSIDYWGFYNGHNNTNFYPNLSHIGFPMYTDNAQNDFGSNINFTKACSLEQIIYPTGGSSIFEYETHQFDNLLVNSGTNTPIINHGAGLRIKSISNFDENSFQTKKTIYDYVGGVNISKRIMSNGCYVRCFDFNIYTRGRSTTQIISFETNNFLNSTPDSNGNYIGYSKVTTREIDLTTSNNGKIEKHFSNEPNNCILTSGNFFVRPMYYTNDSSLENGLLLKENIFDKQNHLKIEKTFRYSNVTFDEGMYAMRKSSAGYRMHIYWTANEFTPVITPAHLVGFYRIIGKFSRKNRETIKEYFDTESITNITDYNYDFKNNLVQIRSLDPQNFMGTPKQTKSYIYSYNCPWNSTLSTLHTGKNIFNVVCRVSENLRGEESSYTDILYEDIGAITRKKETSIVSNNIQDSSRKIFFDQYDENQNIIQYHLENDIPVAIIWGYHKTLPVAKLENVEYSTISPSLISAIQDESNQGDEQQLKVALTELRNTHPNVMITTYTHYPLIGVRSITDAKGDTQTYHYLNNRLEFVKDKNGNILSENEYHFINQN